jgi:hypothetical protein
MRLGITGVKRKKEVEGALLCFALHCCALLCFLPPPESGQAKDGPTVGLTRTTATTTTNQESTVPVCNVYDVCGYSKEMSSPPGEV